MQTAAHPPWTTPLQTYPGKRKRPTASVASRLTTASLSPTKCCLPPCTSAITCSLPTSGSRSPGRSENGG
ncbi:hypothetical protein GALMADRAFT_779221 [Galerina marginata CBS 339.88]|uniref:Uncharacterized protein n=1 Tax=Galerina marginata (strain CBS 339.88) TaxID=685588 RepID=A0A067SP04_GALM3|nr:hypothetical protein GALMADRAFT_779221 [Galerina marginata CBS 339.88]